MGTVIAMTVHDRTDEVLDAVFAGISLPGNRPDRIVVCFDRARQETIAKTQKNCHTLNIPLDYTVLDDPAIGPRCPSMAWNRALGLVTEDYAFCISSDVILGPHSVGMAYHLVKERPESIVCGKADHCGSSYVWQWLLANGEKVTHRTMTCSIAGRPLGFDWLLPMKLVREIGGYDEAFMNGLCYEDDDFTIRMWRAGADIIFCDDVSGIHLEHKRDHLKDADGRVAHNERLFKDRHGDINYLRDAKFQRYIWKDPNVPGLSVWFHVEDPNTPQKLATAQQLYGVDQPWRAIIPHDPAEIKP
jgi:hypothetical protein